MHRTSLRSGVAVGVVYTLLIGIGMAVMHHGFGFSYGEADMVRVFWAVEIVLTAFVVWAVLRLGGFGANGFGPLNWRQMGWMLPSYALLGVMLATVLPALVTQDIPAAQWSVIALIAFTTALVGFSEEVAFRGVLLRTALTSLSPRRAMLISAIGFALLHSVNILGGLTPPEVATQLTLTLFTGLFLAPVALRVGSLWPLIIWHFLWDFSLITGSHIGLGMELGLLGLLGPALHLILAAILWWTPPPDRPE